MVITIKLISPRINDEIVCWVLAAMLHLLLLFWQVDPMRNKEIRNPIISIDYITEEIGPPPMTHREKKSLSLASKLKRFFKKAEPPKKKESELAGKMDMTLKPIKITEKDIKPKGKLVSKNGKVTDFGFKGKSAQQELAMTEEQIAFASKHAEQVTEKQAKKMESRSYSVASKDLPFQVSKEEGISQVGENVAVIATGKTTKGISTSKKMLIPDAKSSKMREKTFGTAKVGGGFGSDELSSDSMGDRFGGEISGGGGGDLAEGSTSGDKTASGGGKSGGGKYGGIFKTSGGGTGGGGWASIREEIEEEEALSKRKTEEKVIRRTAAKKKTLFEIVGPLANRKIIHKVVPAYPEWAKRQGVDAAVSLHFVVLSNGKVKKNIYVERTSGYSKLDKLVVDALGQWVFAALEKKFYGKEQWGVITFYFSLK